MELEVRGSSHTSPDITQADVSMVAPAARKHMAPVHERLELRCGDLHDSEAQMEVDVFQVQDLRQVVSPFQKAPNEVLHNILSYCRIGDLRFPLFSHRPNPWVLGQVCTRWRGIIWNIPELWKTIIINLYRDGIEDWRLREPLSDIIAKSNVMLELSTWSWAPLSLLKILIPFSDRFCKLSLTLAGNPTPVPHSGFQPISFANLEYLRLSAFRFKHPLQNFPPTFFEDAPRLRTVKLQLPPKSPMSNRPHFPFRQLTRLSMLYFPMHASGIYSILREATHLISCQINIGAQDTSTTYATFILPRLVSLDLILASTINWDHILEPLIAPSLLKLSVVKTWGPFPVQDFINFLRQSHCDLQTLSINPEFESLGSTISLSDREVQSLFHHTPSLTLCNAGFVISPLIIREIQDGVLLPSIKSGSWKVNPEGLDAFMDLFDSCTIGGDSGLETSRPFEMRVGCYRGTEYEAVRQRFKARVTEYNNIRGLSIKVVTLPLSKSRRASTDWGL